MAELKFKDRVLEFLPQIGYHHALMVFIALAIILLSLLLAGCSSSSPEIPSIFLISLFYEKYEPVISSAIVSPSTAIAMNNIVGGAQVEVRVGYFGICVQPTGGAFICNSNATALADIFQSEEDPLNLVWVAATFKDAVVFPYLIIVAIILSFFCFLLLATFPAWHSEIGENGEDLEVKRFPSRAVSQASLALVFIAAVFILVSVLWQHTASVAASTIAQDLGNGVVKSGVGTSAMILGWFAFAFLVIVTIGLLAMILSISLLVSLTDD